MPPNEGEQPEDRANVADVQPDDDQHGQPALMRNVLRIVDAALEGLDDPGSEPPADRS